MTALELGGEAVATQVARLYYDRQLSKVEIGQRLGISRFRVARLLRQARDAGLVWVEYRDVAPRNRDLARQLETRFGLDLCAVADGDADVLDATARLGAEVVAELLGPDERVGIAWGSTLGAMVSHLPRRDHVALTVIPLAGGSERLGRDEGPADLARRCAERLGGSHRPLYAPAFLASPQLRDALAREPGVATVLTAYRRLDTAVVGIGAWTDAGTVAGSSLLASGVLADDDLDTLRRRGAVGELVVHPFDATGRFVAPDLAERSIAIPVDTLRTTRRVIAIAAGAAMAAAIRGALATGIIDVLVTDATAAGAILAMDGR